MGAGRGLLGISPKETVTNSQLLAAVGQVKLMDTYQKLFEKHHMFCAQILATKEDFRDRQHYLNMRNCFTKLLHDDIIPIANENDVVSVQELMFTDNDELAGMIASMMDVYKLLILTSVDGVYDKDPTQKNAKVIHTVDRQTQWKKGITQQRSAFGRGGMSTKCSVAGRLAQIGIETQIINGQTKHSIIDAIEKKNIGTTFCAEKKVSNIKKRIATASGQEKGIVIVNKLAQEILTSPNHVSLLPVGIVDVIGEFQKGDIIKIQNTKKEDIGIGMAQYNAERAKEYIGQKGKKALIHYDYLFIENK